MSNIDKTLFDPGFSQYLVPFLPVYEQAQYELNSVKNFSLKRSRYNILNKLMKKAMLSTLGFWVGCILWGAIIKVKNISEPKEIEGNNFLTLSKEDLESFDFDREFDAILEYISNYSKNSKYFIGPEEKLPDFYAEIVNSYQEFLQLNDNFFNVKMTSDIKIPAKFGFLEKMDFNEIIPLEKKVYSYIKEGDLSLFLQNDNTLLPD